MQSAPEADVPSATILVAEDEALIRMWVMGVLQDEGFRAVEAWHADHALDILRHRADDIRILFTDIRMPGSMDGAQLAHHARRHWPWISIVVASANDPLDVPELPLGSRFLRKPYEAIHLLRHLRELQAAA